MSYFSFIEAFRQMNMLFEGIDDMRKFYKNIPEDEFISYIELDPTYKQGSNKAGTYAKWILGLANNNNLKDKNHVKDLLSRYEDNKKYLKDKDIMKFKSMDELESYLNDDDNYNELSHRQEVRQRQKDRRNADLNNEAYLLYEDSDWEVWIPKTYAASCKLGQGTKWCTASTETSVYYNYYVDDGYLYININKHNPKEKYQFHFESKSFMDSDDEEIDLEDFFLKNEKLYKKFYKNLYKFDVDDEVWYQIDLLKKNGGVYEYSGSQIPVQIRDFVRIVKIQNGVTTIRNEAFQYCKNLTIIEIPDSVTSIGNWSFAYCSSLTSIEIPNSVTNIGDYAFSNCSSLKGVEIPKSITSIGQCVFTNCNSLTSVVIPNSVTSIEYRAFQYCKSLTNVKIPDSVQSIGDEAFYNCVNLTSIEIPNSVNRIGKWAFYHCESLTNIKIPDSVTSISNMAFCGCSRLTSITIPNSVTSIGDGAFNTCSSLKSIEIPNSVTSIRDSAFKSCYGLTIIEIPKSVTSIDMRAFRDCNSLIRVVIPNSVTSIGKWAFEGCTSLTIYCEAESQPSGWNSDWNNSNCPVVWGYKGNKTNESLQEVTNAERKGYGEKQSKQYNPGGQRIKTDGMDLSPLDEKDIYIGHHLYGKHQGKYDVIIPRSIHNKISDRVSEEMNKCAKNRINVPIDSRNDQDLHINSALNSLSRDIKSLAKYGLHVDLNVDALRKQVGTQYIQDVLDDEDLRQQLYIKIFIDEFYEELQASNKIYINDCGKDKINKYKKDNDLS